MADHSGDGYHGFLVGKQRTWKGQGVDVREDALPSLLYPFQRRLTKWALRKGRAALWADTGLGKTFMQVAWADKIPGRVVIFAPLCVAHQTIAEAARLGIVVGLHAQSGHRIEITNYERLHLVDPAHYAGVVLDESSILKSLDGKTRTKLIAAFQATPFRLCCTATPAPNDIAELANHAEFLGVLTRAEMLATFFVHDEEGWRLKGHATEALYRWLAIWGMFIRRPSDIGFSDDGYLLPPLTITERVVATSWRPEGKLFSDVHSAGIRGRLQARRASLEARVAETSSLIQRTPGQWIVWCGLNEEQEAVMSLLGEEAISIAGVDSEEEKERRLNRFLCGEVRVLVTKPKIAGFGLNLQRCAQMIFLGFSDSFETYYQAIRRCWRFGQTHPVGVYIVVSGAEQGVVDNVRRKEADHQGMATALVSQMAEWERLELADTGPDPETVLATVECGEGWALHNGDCVDVMKDLPAESVDLSVYSPPFLSLYTYTASDRDLGNCRDRDQFVEHFGYVVRALLRITKPGRISCCHVAQVASTLQAHGVIGLIDLRGVVIQCFVENGWVYHGDVCIDKNPQAQAVRTHSKALLFVQLKKDASWLRPGLADYLLVFRKPGENAVPIHPDISNDQWIDWARPVWNGIRESDTLNAREARGDDDDRHICPLQLPVIERCIRLWSNPGEVVLSPFAGIGSEGYEAIRLRRRFIGIELKSAYALVAAKNLRQAAQISVNQGELFSDGGGGSPVVVPGAELLG